MISVVKGQGWFGMIPRHGRPKGQNLALYRCALPDDNGEQPELCRELLGGHGAAALQEVHHQSDQLALGADQGG